MTDTTKPTDTIDGWDAELLELLEVVDSIDGTNRAQEIALSLNDRLAERPNRAVARGDVREAIGGVFGDRYGEIYRRPNLIDHATDAVMAALEAAAQGEGS